LIELEKLRHLVSITNSFDNQENTVLSAETGTWILMDVLTRNGEDNEMEAKKSTN